ncbi:glycosyltransferase family 4 protein [Alicyclobacillus cycloheptanicus]|nr:glycosyltransferase family 4 protein [Alicyclobacillus cycloheptanicus]WDM02819.1 glycosyltransferase family 4 protein [Alicyclobacillus cycloheptanicus]
MIRVAHVSTYVPKKCGLATYTHHLRQGLREAAGGGQLTDIVIAMLGPDERQDAYVGADWFLRRDEPGDYEAVARRLNQSDIDLVALQHEFGIFGGEAGEYVLRFAEALQKPLVTTFHTVFETPVHPYRDIQKKLVERSDHIIVMSPRAISYLVNAYGVAASKITYLPHGTPGASARTNAQLRRSLGWEGRKVLLTFGLLSPGKGLELVLEALQHIAAEVPNVLYVIAGQTHPEILKRDGEHYREALQRMIEDRRIGEHVSMMNRYLSEADIVSLISACDVFVTPYPGMQQITSGTLAYAVGAGSVVASTPYAYARDLLKDFPDLLIPYGDVEAWSRTLTKLLQDDALLGRYQRQIAQIGQHMRWPNVARKHLELYRTLTARGTRRGVTGEAVSEGRERTVVSSSV